MSYKHTVHACQNTSVHLYRVLQFSPCFQPSSIAVSPQKSASIILQQAFYNRPLANAVSSWSRKAFIRRVHHVRRLTCTYFNQMRPCFSTTGPSGAPQICGSVLISELSLPPLPHSLFTLTQSWWWAPSPSSSPQPTHPPTTSLPPLPDGPTLLPSPSPPLLFYLYIYLFYPGFAGYRF